MRSPQRSTRAIVIALLLALALLTGLIVLTLPTFQIPGAAFVPAISQEVRRGIAAGVIGLLFLALVGCLVRRYLIDLLAKRRESKEAEIRPEALVTIYCRKLVAQFSQLRVMEVARPFDLEKSYIPLKIRGETQPYLDANEALASPLFPPLQGRGARGGGKIMSLQEALLRFRRLALLGELGAGKTTLLRYLALQAAQGKLEGLPDFPIFVSLSYFATTAPRANLLDFIVREIDAFYRSPTLRSYLEERLEEGSVFLLLDDLDETSVGRPGPAHPLVGGMEKVTEATYRHVVGQINVLTARYPKVPVVVTSQWSGWKGHLAANFHVMEVLGLEQDDVQRFIEGWFEGSSDQARELQSNMLQNSHARVLAANPLLLSLMAFVFEQDGKLLEEQAGLYERVMDLLFEEWEVHQSHKQISRFTAEHQRDLLEEVALHFHLRRLPYFPEEDLSGIIASYLRTAGVPLDWVPTVLERICAQYGLLREQANWYSFPHLTWQEYFAARAISKRDQFGLALEGLSDPWWKGPVLFLAGMLEDAAPLLESILNQEDDIFCSNLVLAGRCLTRKPRIKQAGLWGRIITRLQGLVEGKVHLFLRQRALGVLAEIDGPSSSSYFMSLVTTPIPNEIERTVHRWVTTALASQGDESTAANLMALLSNEEIDLGVRTNVAAALGSLGHKYVIPKFLALLSDEKVDYRVRMVVAEALGALDASPEPYPERREGRRGGRREESIAPQFLRLLSDAKIDYRVRVRMAEALGVLSACPEHGRRDETIIPRLLRLLSNEKVNYNVRIAVAETLGSLGDKSISGQLLAVLSKKKIDPDVRAAIAVALGSLGDRSVIPQLMRLLPDEKVDPSIRWRVIDALGALGAMDDEAFAPALLALLSDERVDSSVRVIVAETLGERTVTPRLPGPIPVGKEAAEALRSLGDRSKIPQFLALLPNKGLDHSVRLKIVEALGALGNDRITAESLAVLLDDEEIGSAVYQALFQVSQRIGVRVFAKNGGGYEIR